MKSITRLLKWSKNKEPPPKPEKNLREGRTKGQQQPSQLPPPSAADHVFTAQEEVDERDSIPKKPPPKPENNNNRSSSFSSSPPRGERSQQQQQRRPPPPPPRPESPPRFLVPVFSARSHEFNPQDREDTLRSRSSIRSGTSTDVISQVQSMPGEPTGSCIPPAAAAATENTTTTATSSTPTKEKAIKKSPEVLLISPPATTRTSRPATTTTSAAALDLGAVTTDYKAMEEEGGEEEKDEIPSSKTSSKSSFLFRTRVYLRNLIFVQHASNEPDGLVKSNDEGGETGSAYSSSLPTPTTFCGKLSAVLCSSVALNSLIFLAIAAGLTYGVMRQYGLLLNVDWSEEINVAFIGSSYLFVNDVPRLMEAVSAGQIHQDSCLHSGGSLSALLLTGNGMYRRWQTSEALIETNLQDDDDNGDDDVGYAENYNDDTYYDASSSSSSYTTYDFGACSVQQLLSGYDQYIQYQNGNRAFYNDGNNPCIMDESYLNYKSNSYIKHKPSWDYVVLADQTKRMASSSARYDTVDALVSVYAPLLKESGAVPIIVDTHAFFWSDATNASGLRDIPYFTQKISEGAEEYAQSLASALGITNSTGGGGEEDENHQAPIIVPIGLAYLLVWEENHDLWLSLFMGDGMHASFHGSYLFAVVLYTQLFGHLPHKRVTVPEHMENLFANSRKTTAGKAYASSSGDNNATTTDSQHLYPTSSEASYLRSVARRIVLGGYVPKSFPSTSDRRRRRQLYHHQRRR